MKILILAIVLIGCGTDESESENVTTTLEPIFVESGMYRIAPTITEWKCADGSSGTINEQAYEMEVLAYENGQLELIRDYDSLPRTYEGVLIPGNGPVEFNAEVNWFGNIDAQYQYSSEVVGTFTANTAMTGTITIKEINKRMDIDCDYTTEFTGEMYE
jgi:hypothetical protein